MQNKNTIKNPIKNPIYMTFEAAFGLKNSIGSKNEFSDHISLIDFGGHEFVINGKRVPFDFETWSGECELISADKVKIKFETGSKTSW